MKSKAFQTLTQYIGIATLVGFAIYGMLSFIGAATPPVSADNDIAVTGQSNPAPDDEIGITGESNTTNESTTESVREVINLSSTPDPTALDTFNYTGILRNTDGTLVNGTRDIRVVIYDEPLSGNALYLEDFDAVNVRDGQFSVVLGDNPTTYDLLQTFETAPLYIGLSTDGGNTNIIPRERVHGVPWAISALNAYDGVPVGGIIDYWWPHAFIAFPAEVLDGSQGWMLCNGQQVTDTESPLNNQFLPDLRGKFTQGTYNVTSIGIVEGSTSNTTATSLAGGHDHKTWYTDDNNRIYDGSGTRSFNWNTFRMDAGVGSSNAIAPAAEENGVHTWFTDFEASHNHSVDVTPFHMKVMKLCRTR